MRTFTHAFLAVLSCTVAASADIFDTFNDGNDDGWTRQIPLAPPFGQGASFSFPGGNTYQIHAPLSLAPGQVGPARAGSVHLDEIYTNFYQQVDIVDWDETQASMVMGFLARSSDFGLGATDGYICVLEADGDFYFSATTNEVPGTVLGENRSLNLDPATDYRITFSGIGTSFTAELFDLGNLATPLATLTATDSTYASGAGGLFIYDGSTGGLGTATAVFDNYASAVPEPATAGMLGLGALFLAGRRRRA